MSSSESSNHAPSCVSRGLALLWPLWVAAVLVPFLRLNIAAFLPLWEGLVSTASALGFWILALGLGWRVLSWFQKEELRGDMRSRCSDLLLASGLGLGLLACVILAAGACFGVSRFIYLITLGILVLYVGRSWLEIARQLGAVLEGFRKRAWTSRETLVVLVVLGICLLQLPAAWTPTLYPDTLRYHFGLTRLFEQAGRIAPIPDLAEANISSNWQMIYMPQLLLSGDGCAQVFNWLTLPWIAMAAGLAGGWMAAIVVVSSPLLLGVAGLGNNDLGVTLFVLCMWLALFSSRIRCPFLLAGIFAGFAVGTKYPALVPVFSIAAGWIFFSGRPGRFSLRNLLFIGMGFILGYLPWLIRNSLWTGDPFYPLLSFWLPWGSAEGKWVAEHYAREMAHYGSGLDGWQRVLAAPWRASVADGRYFESDLGILFWAGAPLVTWAWIRSPAHRVLKTAAAAALMGGVAWSIGPQVTRFLAPIIPIAAIALGQSWLVFSKDPMIRPVWRRCALLAAGLLVGFNLWQTMTSVAGFSKPYEFLLEGMTRDQYLDRYCPSFRVACWLNQPERARSKVLLVGDESLFYFNNPVRVSGPFDRKWIVQQMEESQTSGEFENRLLERGIRYVCIDPAKMDMLDRRFGYANWSSPQTRAAFSEFFTKRAALVRREGAQRVFEIGRSGKD